VKIETNNILYTVRNNFLHRINNPRLTLNIKEKGNYVWIQFDDKGAVFKDMYGKKTGILYKGYWCNIGGHRAIEIRIKEL